MREKAISGVGLIFADIGVLHTGNGKRMKDVQKKANILVTMAAAGKVDPTQTKTFRDHWSADMYNRFRTIKGDVRDAVVTADVFGLSDKRGRNEAGLSVGMWAGLSPAVQVENFRRWLEGRFYLSERPLEGANSELPTRDVWFEDRVRQAYRHGTRHAIRELEKMRGVQSDMRSSEVSWMREQALINAPNMALLTQRVLGEMREIVSQTVQKAVRELASGLGRGMSADDLATAVNRPIGKTGINRARMVARTETVRIFNEASLDACETAGVEELSIRAEWVATLDNKVCPYCAAMDGVVRPLQEFRGLLPAHPFCRCAVVPVTKPPIPIPPIPPPDGIED